ncbi:hypothetical protein [Neokomagataea anthophila]|uniref:Uncharacterized protein n=1 Tax=Neokomagataea anthophila TaxID=2826925 RepID=A0ABS5E504_9PROT|nr:hypothetical protein [Neokomagataea anthophila]MBR0558623.1 hypothetical protein [Neokomagataea anthophila]
MTREKKLLLAFIAVVGVPVVVIWTVCWPLLRPWDLPHVVGGQLEAPHLRALTASEVQMLDQWVQAHRTGWGPVGEVPPHAGDVVFHLDTPQGRSLWVSVWRHPHMPDDVGIQTQGRGPYRMNSFSEETLKGIIPQDVPPPSDGPKPPE